MLLSVKGRSVTISDELASRYEKIGFGPITELFALAEISVMKGCHADDILGNLTDEEIVGIIEKGIIDYCEVSGI